MTLTPIFIALSMACSSHLEGPISCNTANMDWFVSATDLEGAYFTGYVDYNGNGQFDRGECSHGVFIPWEDLCIYRTENVKFMEAVNEARNDPRMQCVIS